MRWLLLSHELNAVAKQCGDLLQVVGQTVIHDYHHGTSSFQEIKDKIDKQKPDRIIVIINEKNLENNSPLCKTLSDYLLLPLYVGQATMNSYSCIPILILTCTTEDKLSNPLSSINIVHNATNELLNVYPHILNARLLTPISDEDLNEKTLLTNFKSLWQNDPDKAHYVTILSDVLPILLALIHDGKASGPLDICNKNTISLNWLEQLYSMQSKTDLIIPQIMETEDITDKFDKLNKQMISPETRLLYQASFVLPNALTSIEQYLQQKSLHVNSNAPKILLITGGCGFIGSTFINHWLETYPEDRIINIDRLDPVSNTKNIQNPQSPNYSLIVADINNKDIVLHLMKQYNITHIVHFAVQAHLDGSFGNSITFTESNVYGTHSVLEASRIYGKIQKFLHISTDEVYGETPPGGYQETSILNPLNPYAATIAAAEFLVKSYGESFKLSYCIIRLSNVYGPRQYIEKVIPTFINNLLQGEKLKVHAVGNQIRHYIYVDDVIRAIESIFNKGKSKIIYNIGTQNGLTILDIAKVLLEKLQPGKKAEDFITYVKPRSFTEKRYSTTAGGAVETLGWKTEVTFEEGINKTIQWYRENQNYWVKQT